MKFDDWPQAWKDEWNRRHMNAARPMSAPCATPSPLPEARMHARSWLARRLRPDV